MRPSAEAPKRGKGGERAGRRRQTVKDVNELRVFYSFVLF